MIVNDAHRVSLSLSLSPSLSLHQQTGDYLDYLGKKMFT